MNHIEYITKKIRNMSDLHDVLSFLLKNCNEVNQLNWYSTDPDSLFKVMKSNAKRDLIIEILSKIEKEESK